MKKFLVGLALIATPLIGCGQGEEQSPVTENGRTTVMLEDGRTMSIIESKEDLRDRPGAVRSASSGSEADACWVVLDWCVDPETGGPSCTATGCTISEAIYHCQALIDQYC